MAGDGGERMAAVRAVSAWRVARRMCDSEVPCKRGHACSVREAAVGRDAELHDARAAAAHRPSRGRPQRTCISVTFAVSQLLMDWLKA